MRALTVRQPWAWAIVHGGKDVENRTRNVAGSYRGPVAIHVSRTVADQGMHDENIRAAWAKRGHGDSLAALVIGAFIGVVDLVDVHLCKTSTGRTTAGQPACFKNGVPTGEVCSPWAIAPPMYHLELANPRPLTTPIPCRGQLGLWTPPDDVLNQLPHTHNQEKQR